MSLAHAQDTIPAHPLGIPVDGRPRYGMTPDQACLYRALVKAMPHDKAFRMKFRTAAAKMGIDTSRLHVRMQALVERGWMHQHRRGVYGFVAPVKLFKVPRGV
jgi:hypothetical protein